MGTVVKWSTMNTASSRDERLLDCGEPALEEMQKDRPEHAELAALIKLPALKLYWRACYVRHSLHVLPGETFLEVGSGDGAWTKELNRVFRGENPITAVSNIADGSKPAHSGAWTVLGCDVAFALCGIKFDYIVGSLMDCGLHAELITVFYDLLKPGGRILLFQSKTSGPLRRLRQSRARKDQSETPGAANLKAFAEAAGFTDIALTPYDLIPSNLSQTSVVRMDAITAVLEHAPAFRSFANTIIFSAAKPGGRVRPSMNLADHRALYGTVSVVIPCHNEEANIQRLIQELLKLYGLYIREIIVVNDNSTDGTGQILSRVADSEPRLKVITRGKPNGVGLALTDGYQAAQGRYILSMDSDFVDILPEFRGLFDAIANGSDGAIGSRFSHESVLVGYPFWKMVCNRLFHLLIRLTLVRRIRDVSNNLKLYKSEVLKGLEIESPRFSANLETGLKPILAGYDVREVPISWIGRSSEMGVSSFALSRVMGDYVQALLRIVFAEWSRGGKPARKCAEASATRALAATQR